MKLVETYWPNKRNSAIEEQLTTVKRISQLVESPSPLSWLTEILEIRKGLIIWVALREGGYERYLLYFVISAAIVSLL